MDLVVVVGGVIVFALVALAVYAIAIQRRAVATQDSTVSAVLPAQQEGLALARESVELQRQTVRLLTEIVKGK